jgi:uncharacterized protein YecE (DUF72 family)
MAELYIGTSGWAYSHWEEIFYPENLKSTERLKYFSQKFKTVEVNYSFYHLPRQSSYQKWYSQTPGNFLFSLKVSRFITHVKRLRGVREAWKGFLENALNLKEKLGPFLFQFPSSFQATEENIKRLKSFLKLITKILNYKAYSLKFSFEFRHQSWCGEKTYNLLKRYNTAWVIADSSRYPRVDMVTSDFVYVRLHGPEAIFSSKYTKRELKELALEIKKWLKKDKDVFVYFNNDILGYAIKNAKELLSLTGEV